MKSKICPVCGNKYNGYPAISRKDNKTEICPDCGVAEALKDFVNYIKNKEDKNDRAVS